ncbi:MAG: lysylphosphatidylglycerol synthase transmembrane domain-containing protein [bacterium]|nr:lysylphosphatidylglycerol synthase transmembrane domain-containing protein [bacterium]
MQGCLYSIKNLYSVRALVESKLNHTLQCKDQENNSQIIRPDKPATPTSKKSKKTSYLILSTLVTIAVFSFLFSHITFSDVVSLLENAYIPGILMFVALSFVMSFFRAWRYLILLKVSGYSPNIVVLYMTVLVGNFFSDLLPARTGSLIYVFLITTRLGVPFAASASSFAIAFLFDLLSLAPILALIAMGSQDLGQISIWFVLASGLGITVLSFLLLRFLPNICTWCSEHTKLLPFLSNGKKEKLSNLLCETQREIDTAQKAGVYTRLFFLSGVIRLIKYGAQYMVLFSLLQPLGYMLPDLNVFKVYLGICAAESAASLPFAGIAGFGIFEGTWALVFELLGFPSHIAKVTSISLHFFVQIYGYILGAIALGFLLLPIFKTKTIPEPKIFAQDSWLIFYTKLIGSIAILLVGIILFVTKQ